MRSRKHFKKTVGYYFFVIKMGHNSNITISRSNREEAIYAYENYLKQKKRCEWLGKWEGKKFSDDVYTPAV